MTLAKSLLQTYLQYRFKMSANSISFIRTHSLALEWLDLTVVGLQISEPTAICGIYPP